MKTEPTYEVSCGCRPFDAAEGDEYVLWLGKDGCGYHWTDHKNRHTFESYEDALEVVESRNYYVPENLQIYAIVFNPIGGKEYPPPLKPRLGAEGILGGPIRYRDMD